MLNNLPKPISQSPNPSRKILTFSLLFLGVILIAFIAWANFSPPEFKKEVNMEKPTPTAKATSQFTKEEKELIKVKKGSEEAVAGENCYRLITIIGSLKNSSESANLSYDLNKDGKIDFSDINEVIKKVISKAEEEKWCQEILARREN